MENEIKQRVNEFFELWKKAVSIRCADADFMKIAGRIGTAWANIGWPETDDPIDDYSRLTGFHRVFLRASHQNFLLDSVRGEYERRKSNFIDDLALNASESAPGWTEDQWKAILSSCLSARYGGTRVRIKANPAREKREAAKKMTAKQLMDKFGISRSYAYKLLNENTVKK